MSHSHMSKTGSAFSGLNSPVGMNQSHMIGQPGMSSPQHHHHPYMTQTHHSSPQSPISPRATMMMNNMGSGPVSQRMQQQPSSYSPQHQSHSAHNMYGLGQQSQQMSMMANNYSGPGGGPPIQSYQSRHPIIARSHNTSRPQPIVSSHHQPTYPRNRPRNQRNEDKSMSARGVDTGSGEPAREPLRDVVKIDPPNLTNIKEKTPMCLVNELARYNKVNVQYILEDEQGPAHQKTFFMKLKLGDEEYSGTEASIRKAQQHVASLALEKSELKKPPERPEGQNKPPNNRREREKVPKTVELNNLVMRRGEEATYSPMRPRQQFFRGHPNFNYHGLYSYGRTNVLHYVSLKISTREFVGFGPTPKAAKNQAAAKALRILRCLPMPEKEASADGEESKENVPVEAGPGEQIKSEVSLIHEIALKRNVHVSFEVCMVREVGPAHRKMFTTRCILGDLMCESEAQSKKESKRMAAEKMLKRLRQNGPLQVSEILIPGKNTTKVKKTKNLIKTQKGDTSYGIDINPISRLIQIMQAQKQKEPDYSYVAERGFPGRKEFIIQVQCGGKTVNGVGQNKKLAKRNAAENMLNVLGLNQPSPIPGKPALKTSTSTATTNGIEGANNSAGDKKVSFVESRSGDAGASDDLANKTDRSGRQLIPGLILLPDAAANANTPYIKGRMTGIADSTDLGARRLASGGDGGHVTSGMPPHLQQELTRMVNSHNMDVQFNNTRTEGSVLGRGGMTNEMSPFDRIKQRETMLGGKH